MNVFVHELRQNRNSTIVWIISLVSIAVLYISIFPSISGSAAISDVYANFPEAFKKTFGIKEDILTAFPGLYAFVLNLILLTGAVQAMNLGTGITSKEVRERTADFLLTRPISRVSVMRQKLLTVFLLILVTDLVFMAADWAIIQALIDDPFRFKTFFISTSSLFLMPSIFFIQLWFLMIGASFAAIMRRPRRAGMYAAAVLLATFIISAFVDLTDRLGFLRYTTPFKYFDAKTIFSEGRYSVQYIVITVVAVTILLAGSQVAYKNRDLNI